MQYTNVYDLQDEYIQIALDRIADYQGDFSGNRKQELLTVLKETEQEFMEKVKRLPKTEHSLENRKLLSMTQVTHKFIQALLEKVIGTPYVGGKLCSMKDLVEYITGGSSHYIAQELVENLDSSYEEIPQPDIQGTIEQIGHIILPPDILEIIRTAENGEKKDNKNRPAGFDKIGLVEEFLSGYLGRERKTFQWKEGILREDQMRKVSYFHLYLPEIDKTLLINNQYGEGCFLLDGNFTSWKKKKSDIKGMEGVVALSFDYSDPEGFLEKLKNYLDQKNLQFKEKSIGKERILKIEENSINIPTLGENGQVEIEGKIYQWVGVSTPVKQLWNLPGPTIRNRIKTQSQEWKDSNIRKVKSLSKGPSVEVCEITALKELLEDDINIPTLGESGQVEIEGKTYQWIGATTPIEQLGGIQGPTVRNKIKEKSKIWKKTNIKKAKSNGLFVEVCEIIALKELLQEYRDILTVGSDGKVEIEGKIYQWVGVSTPVGQLWGINGQIVRRRIDMQLKIWKDKNIRKVRPAKMKGGLSVEVCEITALKELLEDDINILTLGENGQVEIEGKIYQWVGQTTPVEQLWGINGKIVRRRIDKQSQTRKDTNVRPARTPINGGYVEVCEINALKELLQEDRVRESLRNKGQVQIRGKTYQRIGQTTPAEQLWGIPGWKVKRKINQQSQIWKNTNLKKVKSLLQGPSVEVCEITALEELLKDDIQKNNQ